MSPLAEGRELKFRLSGRLHLVDKSPLAEGRELKYDRLDVRPREQLVAPRGGA